MSKLQQLQELTAEGDIWFMQGRYENAIMLWENVLAVEPGIAFIRANVGIARTKLKQWQAALPDLRLALSQDSTLVEAWQALGYALTNLGRLREALTALDQAVKLRPGCWRIYFQRGCIHGQLQIFEKALQDYSRALELNPQAVDARNNRGNIYMDLGHYAEAIRDFTVLLEQNPEDALAHYNRGIAYSETGKLQQAAADFQQAALLDPSLVPAKYNLACIYVRQNEMNAAVEVLQQIFEADPAMRQHARRDPDMREIADHPLLQAAG